MRTALIAALFMPGLAMAAGGDDHSSPKPSPTSQTCTGVQVWDASKGKCVNPQNGALDADTLYDAVRELAYADRIADAQGVLRAMPDQTDDRVLTYWGFTHRKLGNVELAQTFYRQAIAANPDNLLARSYMAQGFVAAGEIFAAVEELREIRARGGAGTWPEQSLVSALETGRTYNY
ncbi:MAG: hypothetical protein NXH82_17250 [Rhodobacteraceae bacterium]|nr:hypothetical protein [Paracoccaceae bacterium]